MEALLQQQSPLQKDKEEVLVFRTSVASWDNANQLAPFLDEWVGQANWNFALDDCDKILRVVSHEVTPQCVIQLLLVNGYRCEELED